jgi:hypothetical protein
MATVMENEMIVKTELPKWIKFSQVKGKYILLGKKDNGD